MLVLIEMSPLEHENPAVLWSTQLSVTAEETDRTTRPRRVASIRIIMMIHRILRRDDDDGNENKLFGGERMGMMKKAVELCG